MWHRQLWLIDHGAALYFHHQWEGFMERAASPFTPIKDHVLLPFATELPAVDAAMAAHFTPERVAAIVALIPDSWLPAEAGFAMPQAQREAYAQYFARRLQAPRAFAEEAARAHAAHV
jgi:hypothetical protein